MTDREAAAKAELEDTLRRLAPDLLDRDDAPLVSSWTLIISTVTGEPGSGRDGGDVDVLAPDGALMGHVLGDVRIAAVSLEDDLRRSWE